MLTRFSLLFLLAISSHICMALSNIEYKQADTLQVNSLNKESYNLKFSDPNKAVLLAERSLKIANAINYKKGIAESYRMMGIAYNYANKKNLALNAHFKAITIFKKINDIKGEAQVLNNIGNIYNQYNNTKALEYYHKTLKIAENQKIKELIAGSYLNIGTIYFKNGDFKNSLLYSKKSKEKFLALNNIIGIIQSTQSIGVNYYSLKKYDLAEKNLLEAQELAKKENLPFLIGSINLTLTSLSLEKKDYNKAELYINQGINIANNSKDSILLSDFSYKLYELERGRGNYKKSLEYLIKTVKEDSINYNENINTILQLNKKQNEQDRIIKENELAKAKQKNTIILFVAAIIVLGLSLIFIFILIRSKKKIEKTNKELLFLNKEISLQRENLNRINTRLEEIIEDRTKDLISKNRKLSEYSYHLSHQVRGPVATLKGLIMLSQDNLIEEKECIEQMKTCVDDIDEQIININSALHDPNREGLSENNS